MQTNNMITMKLFSKSKSQPVPPSPGVSTFTMTKNLTVERKVARLNKSGTAILEEYLKNHPEDFNPPTLVLKSLLEQVQTAQDNSEIKLRSLRNWFRRHRQTDAKNALPIPFSKADIQNLHTLIQATPEPSPELLQTWAMLFHVPVSHLLHAMAIALPRSTVLSTEQPHTSPISGPRIDVCSQRLPTPGDSLTPEPARTDQCAKSHEYIKTELRSPMLAPSRSFSDGLHHAVGPENPVCRIEVLSPGAGVRSSDHPCSLQLSPPPTPVVPSAMDKPKSPPAPRPTVNLHEEVFKPRVSPLQNAIYLGVQKACLEALSTKDSRHQKPSTTTESDLRFTPYRKSLEQLSRMLNVNPPSSLLDSKTNNNPPQI